MEKSSEKGAGVWKRWAALPLVVLWAVVLVGLLSVDYGAALVFFGGSALAWLIVLVVCEAWEYLSKAFEDVRCLLKAQPLLVAGWLVLILTGMGMVMIGFRLSDTRTPIEPIQVPASARVGEVKEYRVSAEMSDSNPHTLHVREEIILESPTYALYSVDFREMFDSENVVLQRMVFSEEENKLTVSATVEGQIVTKTIPFTNEVVRTETVLQEREVTSTNRGFLLRETSVVTPSPHWGVARDGFAGVDPRFVKWCDTVQVEVTLPKGAFQDARKAFDMQRSRYGDSETVTWSLDDLRQGVTFSYVPPPYCRLRSILEPFLGLKSAGQWVVGIVGLIVGGLLAPVVGPTLVGFAKTRLGTWLESRFRKKPKDTARLVVSETGEEKEIEIH